MIGTAKTEVVPAIRKPARTPRRTRSAFEVIVVNLLIGKLCTDKGNAEVADGLLQK
jgi:hypothetical protein